jgi:hypothetical protein
VVINYSKNGYTLPDYRVQNDILLNYEANIDMKVSNELIILAARALIAEGKLDYKKVEFQHEGKHIGFANEYGQLLESSIGFCDHTDSFLDKILDKLFKKPKT